MTMEDQFDWSAAKNGTVSIRWQGRVVTILRGTDAVRFQARIAATDAAGGQLVMAKVTGNFKRGNERGGKSRAHET